MLLPQPSLCVPPSCFHQVSYPCREKAHYNNWEDNISPDKEFVEHYLADQGCVPICGAWLGTAVGLRLCTRLRVLSLTKFAKFSLGETEGCWQCRAGCCDAIGVPPMGGGAAGPVLVCHPPPPRTGANVPRSVPPGKPNMPPSLETAPSVFIKPLALPMPPRPKLLKTCCTSPPTGNVA